MKKIDLSEYFQSQFPNNKFFNNLHLKNGGVGVFAFSYNNCPIKSFGVNTRFDVMENILTHFQFYGE